MMAEGHFPTPCLGGLRAASWLTFLVTAPPDWRAGLARAQRPGGRAQQRWGLPGSPRATEEWCEGVTWKTASPATRKAACPRRPLVGLSVWSDLCFLTVR